MLSQMSLGQVVGLLYDVKVREVLLLEDSFEEDLEQRQESRIIVRLTRKRI